MWARVSTLQGSPDRFDEGTSMVEERIIPAAKSLPGFAGAIFMGDRETGKLVSVTLWDSEEAMRASEETANQLRADAAEQSGGAIASVELFEVFAQA